MMNKIIIFLVAMALAPFLGVVPQAQAAIVDLTTAGSSGSVGGAFFQQGDIQPAGTGVFDPFVRIQHNGTEQGYNTGAKKPPFNDKAGIWTHNLQLKDVPISQRNGISYYEFKLDINQDSGHHGADSLLSLDRIQLYLSSTPNLATTNLSGLGTEIYNLDASGDNYIKLNAGLSHGSGQSDMMMYVPTSLADGFGNDTYLYFYSEFGSNYRSNGGFEEWGVDPPIANNVNPEPASMALMGLGLAALARRRKR